MTALEAQTGLLLITGEWFAGFVDGEGSIGIARHGNEYLQPRFRLNQRDDDADLVRAIHRFLGVGHLGDKRVKAGTKYYSANAKPQLMLAVIGVDCAAVVNVLDKHPLRSKKRHEYPIWRNAVVDYMTHQSTRWSDPKIKKQRDQRMIEFKEEIEACRKYRGRR